MLTLIKSPQSEADLIDIWLYVSEDQPINADRFLDRLHDGIMLLVEAPNMGVDRPALANDIKSFPVDNVRAIHLELPVSICSDGQIIKIT
ncbi:MAG: toxin ParE1/3/4 [Pseudohongiellaceae bacterium]|jgi:toxin ParE1/3/4